MVSRGSLEVALRPRWDTGQGYVGMGSCRWRERVVSHGRRGVQETGEDGSLYGKSGNGLELGHLE